MPRIGIGVEGKSCASSVGMSVVPACANIATIATSMRTEPRKV